MNEALALARMAWGRTNPNPMVGAVIVADGRIIGSTLTLEHSWHHLVQYAKMPVEEAAACLTINPARDLGLITRGELCPGRRADITVFDTNTHEVRMTVSRGNVVYEKTCEGTIHRK
jgi:N-acetylglucosamine-6-phosphate deacetylase